MDLQKIFFSLEGRLNRKPYIIGTFSLSLISTICGYFVEHSSSTLISIFGIIVGLAVIAGSISLLVKRLHDLDKSGYFGFIALIPIVGFIFGLYLMFAKGTDGPNRFGEDPLEGTY